MSHPAIRDYLRVAAGANTAGPADVELLARFAASRDEAAFELLVWRHAALVQRVCRAVLRDHHAAEDAAQAAFLVLARKAHTFTGRGSVVGWLFRVARRIAVRLAKDRARRPAALDGLDRVPEAKPESHLPHDELSALCAEVDRLPPRYRIPVLLCFFEGLTHKEAASRTGWPVGSVAGRLARAKDLLARRLSRQGFGVATVVLGLPAGTFVVSTAQAGVAYAARCAVIPGVDPSVARLAEGALKSMNATTWKMTAATLAAICTLTVGVWGIAAPQPASPPTPVPLDAAAAPVPAAAAADQPRQADARQRAQSQNNLKQLMLAIYNYHDSNGHFPGNVTDATGKPLLSWRVQILPYIEHEPLYKQFKLDEPWDSENNKKLLSKMPRLYRVGFEPKEESRTYYQVFAGPGTMFEPGRKGKLIDITDGTSNTLGVVEAGPPVEWTKPGDIAYDPKKPLAKREGPFANVFNVAGGDGAAHSLKPDTAEATLRLLIERADGNVVSFKDAAAKFELTSEEIQTARAILQKNEKLMGDIAAQFREQDKLLEEFAKKRNDGIRGIDLEQLSSMHPQFEGLLAALKKENENLRKLLDMKEREAPPKK